jgi:hypothetical protein
MVSRLYARRGEGVLVERATVQIDGWSPALHSCHDNAAKWVELHPGHKVVHGWLYFDFGGAFDWVRFNHHSVIETDDGKLLDITPAGPALTYPFIRHLGSVEEFAEMVCAVPDGQLDYPRPAENPRVLKDLSHLLR